jgi:protein involved in polysaccharide export with SLBB domain
LVAARADSKNGVVAMADNASVFRLEILSWRRVRGGGAYRWLLIPPFLVLQLLALLDVAHAQSKEYLLGPEDKIRLKILEWRPSRDEIFSWEPLNDDYTIGASGDLSLPIIGEMQAGGHSREELASMVEERLKGRMGLGQPPTVAVEIVTYRPFYIIGQVTNSGAFAFRPGLTVLKALSIAGGLNTNVETTERSRISIAGDLNLLLLERNRLLFRLARLQAEANDTDVIQFPSELTRRQSEPAIAVAHQQEQAVFDARREAFRSQMQALQKLRADLQTELPLLDAQLQKLDEQVQSVKEELSTVMSLVDSGLTPESRRMALERALAQIEGEYLRAESGALHARQEVSRAEVSILSLRSQRAQEVSSELREVQAKLEEVKSKIAITEMLVDESNAGAPYLISDSVTETRRAVPIYHIVRVSGGQTVEIVADEATDVQPGDTVKVEIRVDRGDPDT